MKKALLTISIILVALTIMAPAPDKAEKLKINDNDWDIRPFYEENGAYIYGADIDGIDCKFGIATAGEHADFMIGVTFSGLKHDGNNWENWSSEEVLVDIVKDPDDTMEDGYIGLDTISVSWNGDDDGSNHFVNEVAFTLIGPSDKPMGEPAVSMDGVLINNPSHPPINDPSYPPLKYDENGWEYHLEENVIVVPLLAYSGIVDFLQDEGYQVTVDVDVSDFLTGSGKGSTAIVKIDDKGWDYVQIQPVLAGADVQWNGDDDGTGIVSGSIQLVRADGSVMITSTFPDQTVWFVCPDCSSGES